MSDDEEMAVASLSGHPGPTAPSLPADADMELETDMLESEHARDARDEVVSYIDRLRAEAVDPALANGHYGAALDLMRNALLRLIPE